MQEQTKQENTSGAICLQDDKVSWEYNNKTIIQFDISDIAVIGEYSNADGPWFDDWFLTFVSKDGQWLSVPFYADNIDELLQRLNERFHEDFGKTCLANSTQWNSVIRYPAHLKDKPLFTLTHADTYKEPKTFLDKILSSVGLGNFDTPQNVALTNEVKGELINASR